MQPQVRLKTSLNYSNWECWNSYPFCRIWGWALASKAKNIIHVFYIFYIYLYTLLRIWFWCQRDHTILKITDPNGLSAKMIKNTISRQISDRSATRFLLQWYLLAMSAVSVLKTALKLTGTSAQAEEFSVFCLFFFSSSYILWFTPFDLTMYNLILHNKHKPHLTDTEVNKEKKLKQWGVDTATWPFFFF